MERKIPLFQPGFCTSSLCSATLDLHRGLFVIPAMGKVCFVLWLLFHDCCFTTRFAGMGNLLKVLTREIENYPHFFLDFESKSGTGVEQMEKGWMEKEEGVFLFLISRTFLVTKPLRTLLQLFSAALFFFLLFNHTHILFLPLFFSFLSCRSQMGNLLKLLTCTELEQGPNFFLDFESELSWCLSSLQLHLLPSLLHIPDPFFHQFLFYGQRLACSAVVLSALWN